MRGINTLKMVTDGLRTIHLPPLRRPLVKQDEAKTEELVQWGICVCVYSLIAHMQKILAGLVQVAEAENSAVSAPVCRHVFEWTALACFSLGKLRDQFNHRDWEEAWKLLTKVALGSHWMRKHGGKYAAAPALRTPIEIPEPVWIPKAVEEYESYQAQNSRDAEAGDSYSLLCDHAHANAACLLRYQQFEEDGSVVHFVDPDLDPQAESFLPFVNCCLIDLLTFIHDLLGFANENVVRPQVLMVREELARRAPARLTGSISA